MKARPEYRSFVLPTECPCFSIATPLFGLAQEQIQWGALLCTPSREQWKGSGPCGWNDVNQKWSTGRNHVASQSSNTQRQQRCECSLKHYSVNAFRFAADSVKAELVVVVRASDEQEALTPSGCLGLTGTNIDVQCNAYIKFIRIYKRQATPQRDYLPRFTAHCLEFDQTCGMYVYVLYACVHEFVYNSSVGGYDGGFCVCVHIYIAIPCILVY